MNIKKYMILGGMALTLGLTYTSCVNDLDLEPIDPTKIYADVNDPTFVGNALAECYAGMCYASTTDPGQANFGDSYNAGMTVWNRVLFDITELPTDEGFWIWDDSGLLQMSANTINADNLQLEMAYGRFYQHIAICNSFLSVMEDSNVEGIEQMRSEVRALRAMTYYWVLDLFGNSPLQLGEPNGEPAPQATRMELYTWLEGELRDLVDNGNLSDSPQYGRVGKDGVEALLARLYLNAEVYTNGAVSAWAQCLTRCNNVIRRHQHGGFENSGLANHYLNLFAANNDQYMPGGTKADENEILWGLPFDAQTGRSYGGSTFLLAGALSGGNYGSNSSWSCLTARRQLSERFLAEPQDVRWSLWLTDGRGIENVKFGDFDNAGYQAIKWTNWNGTDDGTLDSSVPSWDFCSADVPLIRLADLYLMRAECFLHGQGERQAALDGVNYLRKRAGVSTWSGSQLTADNLLDERSRELYYEMTRRSDLIRFGKYVGPTQAVWSWKGNAPAGATIQDYMKLMPLPTNVLAAQPELQQNPGY